MRPTRRVSDGSTIPKVAMHGHRLRCFGAGAPSSSVLVASSVRHCAGGGSEWRPWLRMLPEHVDLPLTSWTEAEVRALGDPDTVREAEALRGLIADSFRVCQQMRGSGVG